MNKYYSVIDLFAGAGGLGEGFSSYTGSRAKKPFKIALSIEKDPSAYSTLLLRSFFKQFPSDRIPQDYWTYAGNEITREKLFQLYPQQFAKALNEVRCIELGKTPHQEVHQLIHQKLGNAEKWVLVGGPPCQAYSLAGRSRMKNTPDFEKDERHLLYQEYLKILADHQPPVFVMENVKGMLSATYSGSRIIERIFRDLKDPGKASLSTEPKLGYRLYALTQKKHHTEYEPEDFLVEAEKFGIPQTRHRVLILGIRDDIEVIPEILTPSTPPSVVSVIGDLPKIRSGLSREKDSFERWHDILSSVRQESWYIKGKANGLLQTINSIEDALSAIDPTAPPTCGGELLEYTGSPAVYSEWYRSDCINIITNHTARTHMPSDLHRYLFASSYAETNKKSAKLSDFPVSLLPAHKNVQQAIHQDCFGDRFRVQLRDRQSTTITSHISKDGHYFIHYDPSQCRSLTVREAARLQTFPDSYVFTGNRTSQYQQVGNAVPPRLSLQIAAIVHDVLQRIRF